jgi:hypothetical protein
LKIINLIVYRYCIKTQHGPFEWSIYKRYRHFHDLHKALIQFVGAETKQSLSDLDKYVDHRSMSRNELVKFISQQPEVLNSCHCNLFFF